ncbi:MAG: ketoacyl-ACP synthase III [Flavobacteriales bacterium]|nr:ketoacyl-ACP synthase III [Flavobacteriales bacterium]
MRKACIKNITVFTPEKVLTNNDLGEEFDIEPDRIFKDTGIRNRFVSAKEELASDIAVSTGEKFFVENPDIKRSQFDVLIYTTSALDYVGPATAVLIHERLGLSKNCLAVDLPMGCAGFTHALTVAKALIENGTATDILLITSDMPTKVLHSKDYHLRSIFSDAGAATHISTSGKFEIGKLAFGTDGSGAPNLIVNGSGARNPIDQDWLDLYKDEGGLLIGRMEMNGIEILKFSLREVPDLFKTVLIENNLQKSDIDLFIFHHASEVILKFLAKKLEISSHKVFSCLENYGNTVSASIPIALSEAIKSNVIPANSCIFIAGFGIGYAWSGTILKTTEL